MVGGLVLSVAGSIVEHVFDCGSVSDETLIDVLVATEDAVRAAPARQLAVIAEIRARARACQGFCVRV